MRTTVRLPEDLLNAAKQRGLETGRTLTEVIEDALRSTLARESAAGMDAPPQIPTFGRGGVGPGVDLDDTAALIDLMERTG
ncbi:MAG TPA: ribbon-helix-helix domain-containing protein [Longimicrobiales bacterium]|jgi:hypothetical protein